MACGNKTVNLQQQATRENKIISKYFNIKIIPFWQMNKKKYKKSEIKCKKIQEKLYNFR